METLRLMEALGARAWVHATTPDQHFVVCYWASDGTGGFENYYNYSAE